MRSWLGLGFGLGLGFSLEELPSVLDQEHWCAPCATAGQPGLRLRLSLRPPPSRYTTFSGPMYAGKYFAEWIELTMLNGMEFAWGELSIEQVMDLSAFFVTQYPYP